MKLYLISQEVNNDYDTYDSAVVAAETSKDARRIKPSEYADSTYEWVAIKDVKVKLIGTAIRGTKAGIVLASFNAG